MLGLITIGSALLELNGVSAGATAAPSSPIESWIAAADNDLDPRAKAALAQIPDVDRRLLALRAYLRAGDSLPGRWSWSAQQLAAYGSTPEGRAAAADIDALIEVFRRENPGYSLQVNRQPRSFERQLAHWNENPGVAGVAASLRQDLEAQLGAATPSPQNVRRALVDWSPRVAAPLAAPGLSAHGQGRAFDFAIMRENAVIAGLDSATARRQWDAAGWARRLHSAVVASQRPFTGPLQSPYEPWHYAYTPTH
jgi:hypothetical protein